MIATILLACVFGLLQAARSFVPADAQPGTHGTTLAFGFVILAALFAGRAVERLKMPRLTGYLLVGLVAGPYAAGLLTLQMVDALRLVEGTAICLIALTAGGELELRAMKPLLASLKSLTLYSILGTAALLSLSVWFLRPWLEDLGRLPPGAGIAASLMLGCVLVSQSPAVVMALVDETASDGELTRTSLGLVVVGDLLIVAMYAPLSALTNFALGSGEGILSTVGSVAWELFGSLFAGAVIGGVLSMTLRFIDKARALLIVTLCVAVAEICHRAHLEPLLVMMAAGVVLANGGLPDCHRLIRDMEAGALPVYLVFFTVGGAIFRLDLLRMVWLPATVIVLVRAAGFWIGSRWAARRYALPPAVRRYAWLGLLPQAGLALALAVLVKKTFPSFGSEAALLILGVAGINQLLSPVALRWALQTSGEAGQRLAHAPPSVTSTPPASLDVPAQPPSQASTS